LELKLRDGGFYGVLGSRPVPEHDRFLPKKKPDAIRPRTARRQRVHHREPGRLVFAVAWWRSADVVVSSVATFAAGITCARAPPCSYSPRRVTAFVRWCCRGAAIGAAYTSRLWVDATAWQYVARAPARFVRRPLEMLARSRHAETSAVASLIRRYDAGVGETWVG
jgi:hypothetical protein